MARSNSRRQSYSVRMRQSRRVTFDNSPQHYRGHRFDNIFNDYSKNDSRRRLLYSPSFNLTSVFDRRQQFFNNSTAVSKKITGVDAIYGARDVRKNISRETLSSRLYFFDPARVVHCIRRDDRRRVIFALGRGGTKVKAPRFTQDSLISCKS